MTKDFFFQRGSFVTTTRFRPPTFTSIRNFFRSVRDRTDILVRYDVYLIGGVLYDISSTPDVDICLRVSHPKPFVLENDFLTLFHLAFDEFLFRLDAQWMERLPPTVTLEDLSSQNFIHQRIRFQMIGGLTIRDGDYCFRSDIRESERYHNGEVKFLTDHLYEAVHKPFPGINGKHFEKITRNPSRTIMQSLKANEFLEMSAEDYHYFTGQT